MKEEPEVVQFISAEVTPAPGLIGNVTAHYIVATETLKWTCYVQGGVPGDIVKVSRSGRQVAKHVKVAESEAKRVTEEAVATCARRVLAALAVK